MCRLCIYCIYIYIIRVYTLEPPPSNRTHSVHVSEGLSITVSLVLQGIGGDRTQSSFFYCRSQVTLVYNMYWSDQHFFGRLIFHFMVKTSKHITQAMGHLGSRCISCISYIYIHIFTAYTYMPPYLTYFYCTSRLHDAAAVMPPVVLFRLPRWEPKDASSASRRERPNPGFTGFSKHLEVDGLLTRPMATL